MSELFSYNEYDWVKTQTCVPLADNKQVAIAKVFATEHKLPLHPDRWKNWDSFLAIHHANRLVKDKEGPILDAGACRDPGSPSVFLPSLQKMGFVSLTGCNLDEGPMAIEDGIVYEYNDITETSYRDNHFAFIACLSTIEHGVNWMRYFHEMARILRPGGYLFTSFDYWEDPVDTGGQMAFGAPIRIFTKNDVMQMSVFAVQCGLHLLKAPELDCRERPVEWMGMRYTFMNLLMGKPVAVGMNGVECG